MQPQSTPLTEDLSSVFEHVGQLERILRTYVEFGHPNHPEDPESTELAGSVNTYHNGGLQNMFGSWVEVEVDTADVAFTCYHNLGVVPIAGQLNVRWLVFGMMHDGTGVGATSTLSVNYDARDVASILADSVDLRLYVGGGRTVGEENPVKVTLWFSPAVRG